MFRNITYFVAVYAVVARAYTIPQNNTVPQNNTSPQNSILSCDGMPYTADMYSCIRNAANATDPNNYLCPNGGLNGIGQPGEMGRMCGLGGISKADPNCYLASRYTCYDGNQLCPVLAGQQTIWCASDRRCLHPDQACP